MAALRARAAWPVARTRSAPTTSTPATTRSPPGGPGRNLDPCLVGEERIAPLFAARRAPGRRPRGRRGRDGPVRRRASGRASFASTAHVAALLDAPVVLVVDASAQAAVGRRAGARVRDVRPDAVRIGGVILNRVGSDRHEAILREALGEAGVPVLGVLRRDDAVRTPVPAPRAWSRRPSGAPRRVATVDRAGRRWSPHGVDLDAVLALARSAPPLPTPTPGTPAAAVTRRCPGGRWSPSPAARPSPSRYAETAELLAAAGAEVVTVDPLRDEPLPDGHRGAGASAAASPRCTPPSCPPTSRCAPTSPRWPRRGAPIAAECAGLLYLCRQLDGAPDVRGARRRRRG